MESVTQDLTLQDILHASIVIKPSIFKANDIRGIVGSEINAAVYFLLGLSFAAQMHAQFLTNVVVGRDGRLSSPSLSDALIQGLKAGGAHITDIGLVTSPILYYATILCKTGTGIMVTGSHNPANYNGLKMMMGGQTLSTDKIQNLHETILRKAFVIRTGSVCVKNILTDYIQAIVQQINIKKKLKVVIDCGHGASAIVAKEFFSQLNVEVYPLYCEVDGHFPAHHPDPSKPENLQDLIQKVQEVEADCGLAFDGDGDRLGVVSRSKEIIWPDRILMIFAQQVLAKHPGSPIIYDVKCTQHLEAWIKARKGVPSMQKTGHALIKAQMYALKAPLAGEMSGHFFFSDRWHGFDDALYAGARLLEIMSELSDSQELFDNLPNSINTPEIQISIDDAEKFQFVEQLKKSTAFETARRITIDGLRVEYPHGWGLVRASNTSPCLVMRFEANTQASLDVIKNVFKQEMLVIKENLEFPF